jgi:hypothetical protein
MKQIFYISLILCFNIFFSNAQMNRKQVLKDIQKSDSIVCFGLDFSNAKLIGEFPDKKNIMQSSLETWNSMLVSSDILKSYRTKPFLFDFSVVSKRNRQIKENEMFTVLPMSLTPNKIQSIINEYDPVITKGKGLVYMVESFDKNREEAQIWVVYFQIETKKVLYAQNFTGIASGINIQNHWGTAVKKVIKESSFLPSMLIVNGIFVILLAASITFFVFSN